MCDVRLGREEEHVYTCTRLVPWLTTTHSDWLTHRADDLEVALLDDSGQQLSLRRRRARKWSGAYDESSIGRIEERERAVQWFQLLFPPTTSRRRPREVEAVSITSAASI